MPDETSPSVSVGATPVCPACGQPLRSDDDRKRRRFWWGAALAWLPFLPLVIALAREALTGISEQKATGLGAVAGGIAEMGVLYVVTLAPIFTVSAIVLLLRSFSKSHPVRNILAVVSLCWTVLMMSVLTLLFWLVFVKFSRH